MGVDLQQAAQEAEEDVLVGGYTVPWDVWNAIYGFAIGAGHVDDPFEEGDSCWKLAFYLGICACESGFANLEGDPAYDVYSGAAWTCCVYYSCLDVIWCSGDETAWDRARAHAPYGDYGAYLSHGWYQLYVCGQGAGYVCDPARLHEIGLHMAIALPHIENAINTYWDDDNVEQSVRTCAQASGHPGWVGDNDYRINNIWAATQAIQPDLCEFLLGGDYDPPPDPPDPEEMEPSPLPPIDGPTQTIGPGPLPEIPDVGQQGQTSPLPELPD